MSVSEADLRFQQDVLLTCSCMRAYDSAMRTTASSWRTVIGTTGVSLSFSLAAALACKPQIAQLCILARCMPFKF